MCWQLYHTPMDQANWSHLPPVYAKLSQLLYALAAALYLTERYESCTVFFHSTLSQTWNTFCGNVKFFQTIVGQVEEAAAAGPETIQTL